MRQGVLRRQFDRSAAGAYDLHASVQRIMAVELAQRIQMTNRTSSVYSATTLEIGCGTGYLTQLLTEKLRVTDELIALDIAPAMLRAAKQRISVNGDASTESNKNKDQGQLRQVRFIVADVEEWVFHASTATYQWIVSNACFQWLSYPDVVVQQLERLLIPGGNLLFTTFGPRTFYELHAAFDEAYQCYGQPPQRHGLSFHTANEWLRMLEQAGFVDIQYSGSYYTEYFATVRHFLSSIKSLGASASEAAPLPGISNRCLFHNMFKFYEKKFGNKNGIPATYDVLIFQAAVL